MDTLMETIERLEREIQNLETELTYKRKQYDEALKELSARRSAAFETKQKDTQ
jgi:hypothetical protein